MLPLKFYTQSTSLMGTVASVDTTTDPARPSFTLQTRSGDAIPIHLGPTTYYQPLTNLDGVNRDRYPRPKGFEATPANLAGLYLHPGTLVSVQCIHQRQDQVERFEARAIHLLQQAPIARKPGTQHDREMGQGGDERRFYFEFTYWWINQIQRLADKWLDDLFDERRDYQISDFAAFYRTNLNIVGQPVDDQVQEMATLSRLIFGLSSAYLLTGIDRYRLAARAGVEYQREAFRGSSADARFCFWASAKRRMKYGSQYVMTAQTSDDRDTIPLYEQIYALAGLAQYYRITADPGVLDDIRRTVQMIRHFFRDKEGGGYFSHLDFVTFQTGHSSLDKNQARKNWNSVGDHLPAYLINLILALEPLPDGRDDLGGFLEVCKDLLKETTGLICEKFPERDPSDGSLRPGYVRERFHEDWSVDTRWDWQQDRAIVGHNLKIAWNLTRAANYYEDRDPELASKARAVADHLGTEMVEKGLDLLRGGCFDAVERNPKNGMPVEFAWGNTKDFWQQEQGILAYLILHGNSPGGTEARRNYLDLAREMMAFWNLYFLDREHQGVFFRTTESGLPVVLDGYGNKAGHSVAGYHAFELNFLAHIYLRAYVDRPVAEHRRFTLYFRPEPAGRVRSINVLPDFFRPGTIQIASVTINGRPDPRPDRWAEFQVRVEPEDLGTPIVVEFQPLGTTLGG